MLQRVVEQSEDMGEICSGRYLGRYLGLPVGPFYFLWSHFEEEELQQATKTRVRGAGR